MKRKFLILGIIIIIGIILFIFLMKNDYKFFENGNNMSNKSADEIKEYILNINSYEATVSVTVNSNKNTNTYLLKQECYGADKYKQEVLEPSNIQGLTIFFDGSNLKIENTNLNLNTIYENYQGISENMLWLSSFIDDYKSDSNSKLIENENELILQTKVRNDNKYIATKKLYIDRKTAKPTKLEVQDSTQNTLVYILYNEIQINNLRKG